jgi:hypothetical protein
MIPGTGLSLNSVAAQNPSGVNGTIPASMKIKLAGGGLGGTVKSISKT